MYCHYTKNIGTGNLQYLILEIEHPASLLTQPACPVALPCHALPYLEKLHYLPTYIPTYLPTLGTLPDHDYDYNYNYDYDYDYAVSSACQIKQKRTSQPGHLPCLCSARPAVHYRYNTIQYDTIRYKTRQDTNQTNSNYNCSPAYLFNCPSCLFSSPSLGQYCTVQSARLDRSNHICPS